MELPSPESTLDGVCPTGSGPKHPKPITPVGRRTSAGILTTVVTLHSVTPVVALPDQVLSPTCKIIFPLSNEQLPDPVSVPSESSAPPVQHPCPLSATTTLPTTVAADAGRVLATMPAVPARNAAVARIVLFFIIFFLSSPSG